MKNKADMHLNEKQILSAIIDAADLDPAQQAHLSSCAACRNRKQAMEAPFLRLGQLASQYSPGPSGLPRRGSPAPKRTPLGRAFGWRPVLVSAIGLLFIAAGIGWHFGPWPFGPEPIDTVRLETIDDAALMAEVDALIDGPLPEAYRRIAADADPRLTDDFMRFVAPLPENDSLSFHSIKRGGILWQTSV